ncbi:hypothetical protein GUJ93_ZPchr0013g36077 [Zizania palustris]|uniref:Vitamin K epoxide reductase domain-containing protein n=1 Tax=Zizania palustris TaxID=103762 RepID=A0A8J6BTD6_ZIZPA|nr:hypothetical protein GUJ93_ZPchr0013g36077 [Zizania palustris]
MDPYPKKWKTDENGAASASPTDSVVPVATCAVQGGFNYLPLLTFKLSRFVQVLRGALFPVGGEPVASLPAYHEASNVAFNPVGHFHEHLVCGCRRAGFPRDIYLSYLKLTGSEAFCPVAGGGCGNVLESDDSIVFGIPLPLLGLAAYGLVTTLSLQ